MYSYDQLLQEVQNTGVRKASIFKLLRMTSVIAIGIPLFLPSAKPSEIILTLMFIIPAFFLGYVLGIALNRHTNENILKSFRLTLKDSAYRPIEVIVIKKNLLEKIVFELNGTQPRTAIDHHGKKYKILYSGPTDDDFKGSLYQVSSFPLLRIKCHIVVPQSVSNDQQMNTRALAEDRKSS